MEKAAVDAKVQKLAFAYDRFEQDRWRLSHRKASLQQRLAWIDSNMGAIEADAKLAAVTTAATPLTLSSMTSVREGTACIFDAA